MASKLIFGVGVNDSVYNVYKYVNNTLVWKCPYYTSWVSILRRSYSQFCHKKNPAYIGCAVCEEWHLFSTFKSWMEVQEWEDKHLDKDLLKRGNRVYSPETCVFISGTLNSFMTERGAKRGEYPVGVHLHKPNGKFASQCRNPFTLKKENLGMFDYPHQAHAAWLIRKQQLAFELASVQTNPVVAAALINRYIKYEEE